MDYFRQMVRGERSGSGGSSEMGGVEAVERLVGRLDTSTTFEDRRDAAKTLRALAKKKYRREVGSIAMPSLINALKDDLRSAELVQAALEALCFVVGGTDDDADPDSADELGERFAEVFVSDAANVRLVVSLLDEYEVAMRRPAVRLLSELLRHRAHDVQDVLLGDPTALTKLTEMLADKRELVRNDAVLMMTELTRGNADVQKIVAFQNAFQTLLDIIFQESDSIVVEDCLLVLLNLLKNNPSNQMMFREHSLIQRLSQFVHLTFHASAAEDDVEGATALHNGTNGAAAAADATDEWTEQKRRNTVLLLFAVRTLVSPTNSAQTVVAAQKAMRQCGLLNELCEVMMRSAGVVLTEVVVTVAEAVRGNADSQRFFLMANGASTDDSPVMLLLSSLFNDTYPLRLRCALLYAFQSYLFNNDDGKEQVARTLLPASIVQEGAPTAGQLVCNALVSRDQLPVWFGAVALMHCLFGAPAALKEQLLRAQLATSPGEAPVSLLQEVCARLAGGQGARRPQLRAGLLMLLGAWLVDCPVAVAHFLQRDDNVNFLTQQLSSADRSETADSFVLQGLCAFLLAVCVHFNDDSVDKSSSASLLQVIDRRVGRENLAERLEMVSRSEVYVRAAKQPQPDPADESDLLLDYEFTKLFKAYEGDFVRMFRERAGEPRASQRAGAAAGGGHSESIVQSYKELIKRQDLQIAELTQQKRALQAELERDAPSTASQPPPVSAVLEEQVERLRVQLDEKCRFLEAAEQRAADAQSSAAAVLAAAPVPTGDPGEVAVLRAEVDRLSTVTQQWQAEAVRFQTFSQQWQDYHMAQIADADGQQAAMVWASQQRELEAQLANGYSAFEQQAAQLTAAVAAQAHADAQLHGLHAQMAQVSGDLANERERSRSLSEQNVALQNEQRVQQQASAASSGVVEEELRKLRAEHEDLLLLLADVDRQMSDYRARLRHLGQPVTDDEPSDADDNV